MVFTVEHDTFIIMAYFRSGVQNENGEWIYSQQSTFDQFAAIFPEERVEFKIFQQHCSRIVERFFNTSNLNKRKPPGRPVTFITPDVVQNVDQIVQAVPQISTRRLSQQIGFLSHHF